MARLTVTVKTKAGRREVKAAGTDLIVSVTAPPAEGKANEMCIKLVADWLGVPKSSLNIVSGHHHKEKVIDIAGLSQVELTDKLKG